MKSLHLALAAWTALAASGDASAFTAPGAASPPGPASSSSSSSSSSFSSGARPGKVPAAPAPLGMALKNREDRRTSAADKSWGEIFGQAAEVTEVFAKVAGDLAVEALEATRSEEEKKPGGGEEEGPPLTFPSRTMRQRGWPTTSGWEGSTRATSIRIGTRSSGGTTRGWRSRT